MDFSPLTDGKDHINIYSKGRTKLGRLLTNLSTLNFELDGKKFNSMENYWYYTKANMLGCDGEVFLPLSPFAAKKEGKLLPKHDIDFEVFKSKITEGLKARLRQNRDTLLLLSNTTLPFTHYYAYGNDEKGYKVVYLPQHAWQCDFYDNIRGLCRERWNIK